MLSKFDHLTLWMVAESGFGVTRDQERSQQAIESARYLLTTRMKLTTSAHRLITILIGAILSRNKELGGTAKNVTLLPESLACQALLCNDCF